MCYSTVTGNLKNYKKIFYNETQSIKTRKNIISNWKFEDRSNIQGILRMSYLYDILEEKKR